MNTTDVIILVWMAGLAVFAIVTFAFIAKYLFDRGLADRNHPAPNILDFYKTYMAHTRKRTGRIGMTFWIHSLSAGAFITTGVAYTIIRFVLPRVM
jgi:hypothetical protein